MSLSRPGLCWAAALATLAALPARAEEATSIRRVAYIVGANDGGRERARLRYAESDARSVASVLATLGGVAASDQLLLVNPTRTEFVAGFEQLRDVLLASQSNRRTELIVYYSGHSDEDRILLGEERYPYQEFRRTLDSLPADVRVTILDSCASGAMTRRKGGTWKPPFLVDDSSKVQGHAILTSSADDEAAQESDRIKASFFTHYLLSGLRGAADVTRDGRVTLNEAYQFAFNETLARTEQTQSGAQHPAYDIQLSGTGDLVMTDLRGATAGLLIPPELEGRLYVRDHAGRLAAELRKYPGQAVDLGLEPGEYVVTLLTGEQAYGARLTLAEGRKTELAKLQLVALPRELTASRGGRRVDPLDLGDTAPALPEMPAPATTAETRPNQFRIEAEKKLLEPAAFPPVENESQYVVIPLRFSLVPDLNSGRLFTARKQIAALSFNLLGRVEKVRGLEVGFANWVTEDLAGVQVSVTANVIARHLKGNQFATGFNVVGGEARGIQGAAGFNITGGQTSGVQAAMGFNISGGPEDVALGGLLSAERMRLLQLSSGFNIAGGALDGLQVAAGFNVAGGPPAPAKDKDGKVVGPLERMRLFQGGFGFNVAGGALDGGQVSVGFNIAGGEVRGAQGAVGFNVASGLVGAQLGVLNISGDVTGAQVGLVNIAGTVKGVQVGLINISDDVIGLPIGLLNFSKKGMLHFDLFTTDTTKLNVGAKFGTRYFYTVLAITNSLEGADGAKDWATSVGLGLRIPRDSYFLDFDVVSTIRHEHFRGDVMITPRLKLGWQPFRHFALYGGVGVNVFTGVGVNVFAQNPREGLRAWPAVIFGVQL